MTTSGSIDFSVSRDTIITESLMHLGVLGEGGTPTSSQISDASRTLNIMIKAWMARPNFNLWAIDRVALALVAGQQEYITGVDTFTRIANAAVVPATSIKALMDVVVRTSSSSVDIPITIISRQEYWNQGNKTTRGTINQVHFQPNLTNSSLFVYPTSSNSTDTLRMIVKRTLEDFDASGDTPDFPQEWYEALYLGLAARLARPYRVPLSERSDLRNEAELALELAEEWSSREQETSVQITPNTR